MDYQAEYRSKLRTPAEAASRRCSMRRLPPGVTSCTT